MLTRVKYYSASHSSYIRLLYSYALTFQCEVNSVSSSAVFFLSHFKSNSTIWFESCHPNRSAESDSLLDSSHFFY